MQPQDIPEKATSTIIERYHDGTGKVWRCTYPIFPERAKIALEQLDAVDIDLALSREQIKRIERVIFNPRKKGGNG